MINLQSILYEKPRSLKKRNSHHIDTAKLAHDLKGPLNSIKGLLMIASGEVKDEMAHRYFKLIGKYQQLLYARIDDTLKKVTAPERSQNYGDFRISLESSGTQISDSLRQKKRFPFSERIYRNNAVNSILEAFQRVQNVESKSDESIDFVKLSNNIKGPLSSIKKLLKIARIEVKNETARGYFELIEKCQQQLFTRVEETVKRANGTDKSNISNIDFISMIDEIQSSLKHMDGFSDIEFKTIIKNITPFFSDPDAIYSIIQNLMENAIKYRKHDSSFHIIIIELTDTRYGIELQITDNGIGIKQELFSEIFRFRVRDEDSPEEGHGIGLALVKQLTESLGGKISLESEVNQGTTFTVRIPNAIQSPL